MKFITALATLLIAGAAYAEKPVTTKAKHAQVKPAMQGLFAGITLTRDQQKQLAAIMKNDRKEMKQQMKGLRDNRKDKKGNKSDNNDKTAMKELRKKMKARKEALDAQIKSILTPEQLTVFNAKVAERKASLPKYQGPKDKK